jgi:hypothetical protein
MKIKISNRALEGICKDDIVSGLLLWGEEFLLGKDSVSHLYLEDIKKPPASICQGLLWGLVVQGERLVNPLIKNTSLNVLIRTILVRLYKFYMPDRDLISGCIREVIC